ncbi:H-NS family nucleoid-associated regulatory protein [Paraburkholderia jirisanensis]
MASVARQLDGEARERLIRWIHRRMDHAGISLEALEAALAGEVRARHAARYADAYGNTWSGAGDMPPWLKRAVAAGQNIEHFHIDGR